LESFLYIRLLLISFLASESHTVEVQAGQDVTLLCSNISTRSTQTNWFRVVNRTKPCCIPSVFSHIDQVKLLDLSYSGLYFCGLYMDTHKVIASATLLNVQVKIDAEYVGDLDFNPQNSDIFIEQCHDGMTKIMNMILGGLTVFLTIIIIFLAVKVRKLQTGKVHLLVNCKVDNNLNYAALTFKPKQKRRRQMWCMLPPDELQLKIDPILVYINIYVEIVHGCEKTKIRNNFK
uniref:Ig-like domain-containing protein n=1 Tax=Mola mola TaxID=94237 RepID=A0A3Q3W2M8_MOLML